MLNRLQYFLNGISIQSKYVQGKNDLLEFSIEGLNFLAEYNSDNDPTFFRIMLPQIEILSSELDKNLLARILEFNSKYKVGKIIKVGNSLWISAEFFIDPRYKDSHILIFNRAISLLTDMYKDYFSNYHES